ncbi:MAG: hypothetical protein ACRDHZ_23880, partial [Ktedonobacteraceae bacterium]
VAHQFRSLSSAWHHSAHAFAIVSFPLLNFVLRTVSKYFDGYKNLFFRQISTQEMRPLFPGWPLGLS